MAWQSSSQPGKEVPAVREGAALGGLDRVDAAAVVGQEHDAAAVAALDQGQGTAVVGQGGEAGEELLERNPHEFGDLVRLLLAYPDVALPLAAGAATGADIVVPRRGWLELEAWH